jgi:hypothetical protein
MVKVVVRRRRSVMMTTTMAPVSSVDSRVWLLVKMRKTWARPQLVVAELAHIYISIRARAGAGGVIDVDECAATAGEERFDEEASEERRRRRRCRRRRRRRRSGWWSRPCS